MTPKTEPSRMNGSEYEALRALFGLCSEWEKANTTLEKRFKSFPGGWRDAKMVATKLFKLLDGILTTVDRNQLVRMQKDLRNTRVKVSIGPDAAKDTMYTYVPNVIVKQLVNAAAANECAFCDKKENDARKCPLRQALNATLMHDLKPVEGCEYKAFGYWIGDSLTREAARSNNVSV